MVKKSKQILDNKMFVAQCPHMMNQSALRMQLPAVSLYVVQVLFESKVGTLADQLNGICFSNISIISDSYLSNKFGIMSGTLFSLMDSGAVLTGTMMVLNIKACLHASRVTFVIWVIRPFQAVG